MNAREICQTMAALHERADVPEVKYELKRAIDNILLMDTKDYPLPESDFLAKYYGDNGQFNLVSAIKAYRELHPGSSILQAKILINTAYHGRGKA